VHLQDGQEFSLPSERLIGHGKLLFDANWTDQEGAGRPLTKGTGRPVSDPSRPLTGNRAFNRISAPDANSCTGCAAEPRHHLHRIHAGAEAMILTLLANRVIWIATTKLVPGAETTVTFKGKKL
jgi:hypothetical protein